MTRVMPQGYTEQRQIDSLVRAYISADENDDGERMYDMACELLARFDGDIDLVYKRINERRKK